MAKMFPEWISEEERALSPHLSAEFKVYDALATALKGDRWRVFYSRVWTWVERDSNQIRTRESDFIISHPDYGILLLEVKGGGIEVVDGRWTSRDRKGRSWDIGPYNQVASALSRLERRFEWEQNNPFQGYRFSTAVFFPDVILSEPNKVISRKHLQATLDGSSFEDLRSAILHAMKDNHSAYCPPEEARILFLQEVIATSWYLDVPKSLTRIIHERFAFNHNPPSQRP